MIDTVRDTEGVYKALLEMFEEDFVRQRIERSTSSARPETRERLEQGIPLRTLSPGYYRFASHLLFLETGRKLGIILDAGRLAAFEAEGLVALDRARRKFEERHPPCSRCGSLQDTAFQPECNKCGAKFIRKESPRRK